MSRDAQPTSDPTPLPEDVDTCHRVIRELSASVAELNQRNARLEHRLDQLCRRHFGPTSEKDPNQPALFEDPDDSAEAQADASAETIEVPAHRRKPSSGRKALPDHLPRYRVDHELGEDERACPCCGETRRRIGEEVTEQLEYVPSSLFVWRHVRGKYACRRCEGEVALAAKPRQPIEKSVAGPGLLAHVIVSKYGDHIPLHRQEKILKRHKVDIARSTQCGWCAQVAELLKPLYRRLAELIRESHVIQTDDTPEPVQEKGRGRTKLGRFWVYRGDRHRPYTVFDYTADRSRDGPARWLKRYSAYLQADAYSGYDRLFQEGTEAGPLIEVACWAHARRYFYDARLKSPGPAQTAMGYIGRLYEIERRAEELEPEDRRDLRRAEAKPILEEFHRWLLQRQQDALPKSPIGEAIRYTLSNWEALNRYVEDGELSIDNSASERAIRPIAIGRRNWLFAGSDTGGRTAAILFSVIRSCERHEVDPFAYLRDVLARLPDHPVNQLDELLPDRWQPTT